jgi:hypothetical protein
MLDQQLYVNQKLAQACGHLAGVASVPRPVVTGRPSLVGLVARQGGHLLRTAGEALENWGVASVPRGGHA